MIFFSDLIQITFGMLFITVLNFGKVGILRELLIFNNFVTLNVGEQIRDFYCGLFVSLSIQN